MDSTAHVIDLNAVGAVIGRFRVEGMYPRWVIIDRSGELARAVFTDKEQESELLEIYDS